jgi:PAS domain S-box-containing protein/putative nucleotidyltransferase with HDIG domain
MLVSIKRWLAPPSFEGDEEKTIQTRIANTLVLYLGAALLIAIFILIPLFAFQKTGSWIISIIMFCGIAAGRYFLFKGNYRLATLIVFSIIYLCILAMLILSGGNSGTAMFYFATVVLVAGSFLESGVVNGFTIATFLIGVGVSFLQNRGLVSLPIIFKFNSAFSWFATGIGLLFMIRTRDLFVGNLKNALNLAHQQNLTRQQMEARFRAVVEYNGNGVVFMNAERKINYTSPAYQQLLGFTPQEMVGHLGPEYIHPEDRELTGRKFAELLQSPEGSVIIEYRLQRKDGSYCWVETTAANLLDNPDVQAVVLNQRDINERKRVETHNLIIAEVQDFLLHPCELEEIYRLVPEKIKQMIGDGITASAILDEKQKNIRMGSYHGVDIPFEKILSVIGFDPWQKEFPLDAINDEALNMYYYSKLVIVEDGLYSLLTRIVPKPACLLIEKLLRVQKIYGMGFVHKNEHMGGLVILARSDITSHIAAIEQIVNLATIAIERKRAEEEVENSEKRFQALIAHGRDEISLLAADGTLLWESPLVDSVLGYAPNQLEGENIFNLIHPDDQAWTSNLYAQVVQSPGIIQEGELRLLHADGAWRWIEFSAANLLDETSVQAIVLNYRDITERKRAEEALRESHQLLVGTFASLRDAVFIVDANTSVITDCNPAATEIFGYSREDMLGRATEFLHVDQAALEAFRKHLFPAVAEKGFLFLSEFKMKRRDGTVFPTEHTVMPLEDEQSQRIGWVSVVRDITERKRAEGDLRRSEARLRQAQNLAGLGTWEWDTETDVTIWSNEMLRIYGITAEEFTGHGEDYLNFTHPEDRHIQRENIRKDFESAGIHALESGELIDTAPDPKEFRIIRRDGEVRWVRGDAVEVVDNRGNPIRMHGILWDITESKRVEEEKARTAFMLDIAPNAITVHDFEGRFLYANQRTFDLHGYSRGEFMALSLRDLDVPTSANLIASRMQELLDRGETNFQVEHYRKDGSILPLEVYVRLTTWGEVKAILSVATDITERKHSEDQLRKSEAKFRAVVENSNDGILFGDANAVIHYRSPSYSRINGYSDEERVGRSGFETVHPDDAKDLRAYWAKLIANPEIPYRTEYRIRHKDGTWHWIETSGQNLLNNPDVQSVIVNSRDITERKHAEEALKQSELKYRGLFEVNKDGISIFLIDAQGAPSTFIEFNTAAHQMLGYTRDEMLGLSPIMLEPKTTVEQLQFRESEFKTKGIANFEAALLHKTGRLIYTDFTAQLIQYEGKPAVMNIVRDITEREQYENELEAIATLSAALRTAPTRAEMLPVIVEQVSRLINCESMSVEIIDPISGDAVVEAAHGMWIKNLGFRQPAGTGMNATISKTRKPYVDNHVRENPSIGILGYLMDGIISGAGVPLITQDQLIGYMWMGHRKEITESEVRLLSSVADIAANAIYRATLHEQTINDAANLARAYDTTLEGWAHALELRDQETEGHTRRVLKLTLELAKAMGVGESELENVHRGALLHDIGKMGIPDSVLLKPGTLNDREWEIMRQHPEYAYKLLKPIQYLNRSLEIPYSHHEKWDGSGYPQGLSGEKIPLAARIFAIVDVWDALTSNRPYRMAWSEEKAIKHISEQSNKHFDPAVVEAFLKIVRCRNI